MNLHDNDIVCIGGACSHHPDPVEVHLHPTDKPLIQVECVSMIRERRIILDKVQLTVNEGDFVAITGPNGGGKTTLLRIMLNLLKPTSGRVEFPAGHPTIGYLPQKNTIDSHFPITVREVVSSGLLACRGLGMEEKKAMVENVLQQIELPEYGNHPIGRLSGGQLQRVLLGRAIISNPQLLVLDEPLSYIDKHFEAHIYRLIAEIAPRCTILLVSHEMGMISSMANRHLIVDRHVAECSANHHYVASECDSDV